MLVKELIETIEPVIKNAGAYLVDVSIKGSGRQPLFQIFVDQEEGISIERCSQLSKEIALVLDTEYPDLLNYRLEVSSPGLDRALTEERDFRRHIKKDVNIFLKGESDSEIKGTISAVEKGCVELLTKTGKTIIPIETIKNAKIVLKW